jgi:hypothetical protein
MQYSWSWSKKKKSKTKPPLRIGNLIQNNITPLEFIAIRKRKGPHLKAMLRSETKFSYKINNQHLKTQSWTSYKSPHFERMKIHYCLLNLCIKPNKPISIYNENKPIKSRKLTKNPPWENLRETHMGKPLVLSNLGQEPTQDWNTHNQDNPRWSNNVQKLKAN